MSSKKVEWIDVCKGMLITTIVLMHIDFAFWSDNPVGKYIGNFTSLYKVSVFFCVSGLTLKDEQLKDTWNFIKRKIKNLYFKIIVIGLLAVLLHNMLIKIGFYQSGIDYTGKIMKTYGVVDYFKQTIFTIFMANREVIIGPMWYANVLFMALVILAVLDWIIRLFVKNDDARIVRFLASICLMLGSSVLTNIVDFTIPRFNNTLTAVFLIDLGQFLFRRLGWKFNNPWAFAVFTLVLVNLPLYDHLSITSNYFGNPAFLIVVSISSMYFLFFLSQKLGGNAKILSFIGRHSFWIMALHFVAFKIGAIILGMFMEIDVSRLTPYASNTLIVVFYMVSGIMLPCIFGVSIEKIKKWVIE